MILLLIHGWSSVCARTIKTSAPRASGKQGGKVEESVARPQTWHRKKLCAKVHPVLLPSFCGTRKTTERIRFGSASDPYQESRKEKNSIGWCEDRSLLQKAKNILGSKPTKTIFFVSRVGCPDSMVVWNSVRDGNHHQLKPTVNDKHKLSRGAQMWNSSESELVIALCGKDAF